MLSWKIVVVTQKTALEELVERFNTVDQARFYIGHMGGDFAEYESSHEAYRAAVERLRASIPPKGRTQWIDRSFLPTYTFGRNDLVVTLGRDGLVVNTAKYLRDQALLAFNPDTSRVDGVLIPFDVNDATGVLAEALGGRIAERLITMAEARLNDGRSLLAVNDLFLGQKTHQSARYTIGHAGRSERQSSSGIIVSTGAGSTGWYRAVLAGASGLLIGHGEPAAGRQIRGLYRFDAEEESLRFTVREPFESRTSRATLVHGTIDRDSPLVITSEMPQNGVLFGDGVEEDFLEFNSGAIATVGLAARKLHLLDDRPRTGRL